MRAGFVACTLLAVGVLALSEFNHWRSREAVHELARRLEAQRRMQTLVGALVEAETAQRGYLLTGDQRYLKAWRGAGAEAGATMDAMREHYRQDAEAAAPLAQVLGATAAKLAELELTVRLRRGGQGAAAADVMATDLGREKMDAVRSGAAELIAYEERQRDAIERRWQRMQQASRHGIALMSLLVVGAYALVMRQSAHATAERDAQRRQLQAERDALDDIVARRTEELVRLASHLQNSREDERASLARELHDELGAVLTAAKMDVAWLGVKLRDHDPALRARLQALKAVLEDAIELKRRIIEDLRPSLLTNLGLVPALQRLVEDQRARFAGQLVARIDDDIDVPEDTALVVYRIAQESLTNAHKYAHARRIEVSLHRLPRHLELRVSDDGTGFVVSQVGADHHGLAGMRHRLLSIRGSLHVDSAPGRGTVITAIVPLAGSVAPPGDGTVTTGTTPAGTPTAGAATAGATGDADAAPDGGAVSPMPAAT